MERQGLDGEKAPVEERIIDTTMKQGIILYRSKYGATKKYADWLCEAIGFDIAETAKADIRQVEQYETVILCGGLYASGIAGLSFLRKNGERLKAKRLAVFCVGASPYDEAAFEAIKAHNLKDDLKNIPVFYGRGAWDQENMSFADRTLCKMLQKAVAKKDPKDYEPWEKALMSAAGQVCDWTDKKYLEPLLAFVAAGEDGRG